MLSGMFLEELYIELMKRCVKWKGSLSMQGSEP